VLDIRFEDSDLLVIDKPPGVHSVELPRGGGEAIATTLKARYPEIAAASEKPEDGGLIHRLDFDTSGLLIAAKNRAAWSTLRAALQRGAIEKLYLAVVDGEAPSTLTIEGWIGSSSRTASTVRVFAQQPRQKFRALPAKTCFERLGFSAKDDFSVVRAIAPTARRHQIRAHAAASGFPLTGDSAYGSRRSLPTALTDGRSFFLHAYTVSFPHPITGVRQTVSLPMPVALEQLTEACLGR